MPISELPADEKIPAAPLLIAAYAVMWIVLAVYPVDALAPLHARRAGPQAARQPIAARR